MWCINGSHVELSSCVLALFQTVNRGCVFVTHIFVIMTYLFVKKNQAYTCVLGLAHPSILENVLYRGNQAVKISVSSLLSEKSGYWKILHEWIRLSLTVWLWTNHFASVEINYLSKNVQTTWSQILFQFKNGENSGFCYLPCCLLMLALPSLLNLSYCVFILEAYNTQVGFLCPADVCFRRFSVVGKSVAPPVTGGHMTFHQLFSAVHGAPRSSHLIRVMLRGRCTHAPEGPGLVPCSWPRLRRCQLLWGWWFVLSPLRDRLIHFECGLGFYWFIEWFNWTSQNLENMIKIKGPQSRRWTVLTAMGRLFSLHWNTACGYWTLELER